VVKALRLFVATALAEVIGSYLPWLWPRRDDPVWPLLPAAASLALFACLLTLHPVTSGRICAAYGGAYLARHRAGYA
jgi:small multidrug resistance family-3 protein